jgi:sporulation protein YlmC with PRC-barrel domain
MYCISKSMRIGSLALVLMLWAASMAAQPQTSQPGQAGQAGQSSPSGMTQGSQDQGRSTGLQSSQQTDQSQQPQSASQFQPQLDRVNHLIGSDVLNDQGQKIGKVEDIVLDSHDRTINYVVVSYGGTLGIGSKLTAVPWSDIKMNDQKKNFVLNMSADQLKSAPSFDRNNWPNMSDQAWKQRNDAFFHQSGASGASSSRSSGASSMSPTGSSSDNSSMNSADRPAAGQSSRTETQGQSPSSRMQGQSASAGTMPIKYRRVSEIVGMSAKNYQGEDIGDLDDVVIDTNQGRCAFGVLTVKSGFLGIGKEMAMVPWTSIQVQPTTNDLRVNADKQTLDTVAFAANKFPDLQNKQYTQDIYKRFEATPYWEALGYTPGTEQPGMGAAESSQARDASAWKPDSDYNKKFDASKIITASGTIESVGTFRPADNAIDGVRLQIKSDDGKTQIVQLGPRPYMDRQDIMFHYGDKVTVTGSQADVNGRTVIITSKVQNGDKTLELRDAQGKPKWNADELQQQMQQSTSMPGGRQPSSTTPGQPTRPGQSQQRPGY